MQSVCPQGSWTGLFDRSPSAAASDAESPAVAQVNIGLTNAKKVQLKGMNADQELCGVSDCNSAFHVLVSWSASM
jgi:hypothetical protein